MSDAERRYAPAASRNREPILAVLKRVLPVRGMVLEIASGTGEHAVFMARHLPALTWQPSDVDAESRASIDAWRRDAALDNLLPAMAIDASAGHWGIDRADAVVCINMVHISPWAATEGLVRGAGCILPAGGVLYLYGPYRLEGRATAPSNEEFDASLRARNPEWGVREAAAVGRLAEAEGFALAEIVDMPANNVSLVFRK